MTKPRLPIKPQRASRGWRGSGPGASAPVPVHQAGDDRRPAGPDHHSLLVDSREVARLLGIGRTKAFQMMARDELPVVRIGRCVRVSRAGLERWVTEQSNQLTSEPVRHAYEYER
jgi:prophage regulatory protein